MNVVRHKYKDIIFILGLT